MKEKLLSIDWWFFLNLILLITIGLSVQYSAANGNIKPWAAHQLSIITLSIPFLVTAFFVDHKLLLKYSYHAFYFTIVLLLTVKASGVTKMGATRWLNLFGVVLQPSELAKISVILALSKSLRNLPLKQQLADFIIPLTITILPVTLIFLQPSLGSAIIMMLIASGILFISGIERKYFLCAMIIITVSLPLLWHFYLHDYQKSRIITFLHPEQDPFGKGYNLLQSKIAIGSGGLNGRGFLHGSQNQLGFLPERNTDFVFTVFSEEHGFVKTIILILLYLYLIMKALIIAHNTSDNFAKLVASGISTFFAVHIIINIGMVMSLIPVVGIPLPFLSYGGSFILTCIICYGLLLNIDTENTIASKKNLIIPAYKK